MTHSDSVNELGVRYMTCSSLYATIEIRVYRDVSSFLKLFIGPETHMVLGQGYMAKQSNMLRCSQSFF